jgi:uncharacterized protein YecT (DUF1311 family)
MKTILALVTWVHLVFVCVDVPAQTQSELNADARSDFAAAEKQLTQVYQKLLETLDPSGRQKLSDSQKTWIEYREAQAALEADQVRGGSAAPTIMNATRAELTRERIRRLESMLSLN